MYIIYSFPQTFGEKKCELILLLPYLALSFRILSTGCNGQIRHTDHTHFLRMEIPAAVAGNDPFDLSETPLPASLTPI